MGKYFQDSTVHFIDYVFIIIYFVKWNAWILNKELFNINNLDMQGFFTPIAFQNTFKNIKNIVLVTNIILHFHAIYMYFLKYKYVNYVI